MLNNFFDTVKNLLYNKAKGGFFMDWSEFRNLVNEHLPTIIMWLTALIISLISLLITIIKTRTKAVQKKAAKELGIDLSEYVVEIGDATYDLNNLSIKKRGKIHESKNEK